MLSYLLLLLFNFNSIIDAFDIHIIVKTIILILTMTQTIVDFIEGKEIMTKY